MEAKLADNPPVAVPTREPAYDVLESELPLRRLAVYEAGGGSLSHVPLSVLKRSDVTVVDLDENQIERCDYATAKHVGDIQTLRLGSHVFDLVVCFNVIEHLTDVQGALRGFAEAARPNGLVFIAAPNPASLTGWVTRLMPHLFHIWAYKYLFGEREAGKPGHAPFPTIFNPLVKLDNLKAFMSDLGFFVIFERLYESSQLSILRRRHPGCARLLDGIAVLINGMMLNSIDARHGDYEVIFRKRKS